MNSRFKELTLIWDRQYLTIKKFIKFHNYKYTKSVTIYSVIGGEKCLVKFLTYKISETWYSSPQAATLIIDPISVNLRQRNEVAAVTLQKRLD